MNYFNLPARQLPPGESSSESTNPSAHLQFEGVPVQIALVSEQSPLALQGESSSERGIEVLYTHLFTSAV